MRANRADLDQENATDPLLEAAAKVSDRPARELLNGEPAPLTGA